jgi:hypothetical protein
MINTREPASAITDSLIRSMINDAVEFLLGL